MTWKQLFYNQSILLYNTPNQKKKEKEWIERNYWRKSVYIFSTRHFSNQSCINFDVISFPFLLVFLNFFFLFLTFHHDIVNYFFSSFSSIPQSPYSRRRRTQKTQNKKKVKVEIHDAIKPSKSFASGNSLELFNIVYNLNTYNI